MKRDRVGKLHEKSGQRPAPSNHPREAPDYPAHLHSILQLQKTLGNRRVAELLQPNSPISRKPDKSGLPPVPKLTAPVSPLAVPGMTDEQLAQLTEDLEDPELKKLRAKQEAEKAAAEEKQEEEDATRDARFKSLREFLISQQGLNRADVAEFLFKNFSPRDIQILRKYGLKWLDFSHRNQATDNLLKALYAYKGARLGGGSYIEAPSPAELKERHRRELILTLMRTTELMRGGIFSAAGGYFGGEEGAKAGAIVDDVLQGVGALAEGRPSSSHEDSTPVEAPAGIEEPVKLEPLSPTPDPVSAHDPKPATNTESPPSHGNEPPIEHAGPNNQVTAPGQQLIVGGLVRHELAGGHPLERHIGLDDADLVHRLNEDLRLNEASTFTDIETAHAAISNVIDTNLARINAARTAGETRLVLQGQHSDITGRWLTRGAQAPINVSGVTVVLTADPTIPWGFRIVTAYPSR